MAGYEQMEEEIRSRLRRLRQAEGLTAEDLATRITELGFKRAASSVYALENGQTTKRGIALMPLYYYARALGREAKIALLPEERDWELLEVPRRLLPLVTLLTEAPSPRRAKLQALASRLAVMSERDLELVGEILTRFEGTS